MERTTEIHLTQEEMQAILRRALGLPHAGVIDIFIEDELPLRGSFKVVHFETDVRPHL